MDTLKLVSILDYIAEHIDADIGIQTLRAFLYVAQRGSCNTTDIEKDLSMTNASASRNISYWTDRRFDRKPGKGFIMRVEDDYDRRYKILTLTKSGREFYEKFREL